MPHPHLISFVIPAWNEESVLGPTLEAVRVAARQLAEPSEVIVADDSSTDRTAEIARQHGARVVTVQHRQISATRNAGARAAQGDLLIFIDADTIVTPEVVRAAVETVRSGAIRGGRDECRQIQRLGGKAPVSAGVQTCSSETDPTQRCSLPKTLGNLVCWAISDNGAGAGGFHWKRRGDSFLLLRHAGQFILAERSLVFHPQAFNPLPGEVAL